MTTVGSEVSGLAGRYGIALFELAVEQKVLNPVADDLENIKKMLFDSTDLSRLFRSPVLTRGNQLLALSAILGKAEANELTRQFMGVLAQHRRLSIVGDVISVFTSLLARHRGEVGAEIVSAVPLDQEQISEIKETLTKIIGTKVAIDTLVDKGLIGGLIVCVGSRMVDSSLRTKLHKLQLAMKGVV